MPGPTGRRRGEPTYTAGVLTRSEELCISTGGDGEVIDLTERAQQVVDDAGVGDGLCTVFVAHSTCGVTTIECEPGCNADLKSILEELAPATGAGSTTPATPTRTATPTSEPRCSAPR